MSSGHIRGLDEASDVEPEEAVVLIVLKALIECCPQYLCQDPLAGSQVVHGQTLRGYPAYPPVIYIQANCPMSPRLGLSRVVVMIA